MCGICEKKVSKTTAITYRERQSGLKGYAHKECWESISTDTRVIKEGE
jgi:hypothetical protein